MNKSVSAPSLADEIYLNEVSTLPYFHPNITSMQQVFAAVQQYVNSDGHFLLRKSFTKPGTMTVSVLHGKGVKHFSIAKQNGYYFLKDQFFRNLHDLVAYYKKHDVPNIEGITNLRLEKPIIYESVSQGTESARSQSLKVGQNRDGKRWKAVDSKGLSSLTVDAGSRSSLTHNHNTDLANRQCFASDLEANNNAKVRSNGLGSHRPKAAEYRLMLKKLQDKSDKLYAGGSLDSSQRQQLPVPPTKSSEMNQQLKTSTSQPIPEANPYYSSVRNPYEEMVPRLVMALEDFDDDCGERCICGLLLDEAELALGWTMHLSTEPESMGKLFFMGPEGETAWNLPLEVSISLSTEQQEKIQNLLHKNS